MLKSNLLKACLLIPAIVFCLSLSGFSSDQCIPPDCPPNISTIPGTVKYPASWFLKWDPNNPDTMGRETKVNVSVLGGRAPYSWSVSGSGFSLTESQTQGLSNTLYADNTACGSAFITVTDVRGAVEGSVRIPAHGQWVFKGDYCGLSGSGPNAMGWIEFIQGGKKQRQYTFNNCECGLSGSKTVAECDDWINSNCPSAPNCISSNEWAGGAGPCEDASWLVSTNGPPPPNCNSRIGFIVGRLKYYEWECGQ